LALLFMCRHLGALVYAARLSTSSLFFFEAEDGIRDIGVTGVQTCALPISPCRAMRLTKGGGMGPQSAPDGTRIYYWRDASIWSVSSSGGDERPLAGVPTVAPEFGFSWTRGPNGIHFLEGGAHPGVVFFDFATAHAR